MPDTFPVSFKYIHCKYQVIICKYLICTSYMLIMCIIQKVCTSLVPRLGKPSLCFPLFLPKLEVKKEWWRSEHWKEFGFGWGELVVIEGYSFLSMPLVSFCLSFISVSEAPEQWIKCGASSLGWEHLQSCSNDLPSVPPLLTKQQGSLVLHPALQPHPLSPSVMDRTPENGTSYRNPPNITLSLVSSPRS